VKPPTAEEMVEATIDVTNMSAARAQSKIAEASKLGLQADEIIAGLQIAISHLENIDADEMVIIALTRLMEEVHPTYVEASFVFTEGIFRTRLADLMARRAATNVEQLEVATELCKSVILLEATIGMLTEVIETSEEGLAMYKMYKETIVESE